MLLDSFRSSRATRSHARRQLSSCLALAAIAALLTPATLGWLSDESHAPLIAPIASTELAATDPEGTRAASRTVALLDPAALNYTQHLERTVAADTETARQDHAPTQSSATQASGAP